MKVRAFKVYAGGSTYYTKNPIMKTSKSHALNEDGTLVCGRDYLHQYKKAIELEEEMPSCKWCLIRLLRGLSGAEKTISNSV